MAKIFIDPGHGAHDPGAVGKRSKEKDNVLKVGLRLKALLEAAGHTIKMSRSTDVFIALSTRAQMANNWGADYFVSLHNNAATASATGFETFIHNGPVQSKTASFQSAIHSAIAPKIGIHDRGRKRANYAVLRLTKMPAVLIEYAFISNSDDEAILINKVEQLAEWTAQGITSYAGGKVSSSNAGSTTIKDTWHVEYGDTGSRVTQLQKDLTAAGYPVAIDGSFGPSLKTSLITFQKAQGLTPDGLYGPSAQAKMQETLKKESTKTNPGEKHAQASATLAKEVEIAVKHGITDGTYLHRATTREETAVMIVRALKLK